MHSAYLLIAHGSRDPQANQAFQDFLQRFREAHPKREVEGAFLELAKPGIPEGIEKCAGFGATEIFVQPLLLFPGRHVKEHIPQFIKEATKKHPGVVFHYGQSLSEGEALLRLLQEKMTRRKS